ARRTKFVPARSRLLLTRMISRALTRSTPAAPAQTRWAKLPDMVRSSDDLIAVYQLASALFLPSFQAQLLIDPSSADGIASGLPSDMTARLAGEVAGHSPLSAVSVLEQRLFLGERLLRDTDAASMAVSLEPRLPLVDHVLIDCVSRLSDADRFSPV